MNNKKDGEIMMNYPLPISPQINNYNIIEKINILNEKIKILEEKIKIIENEKKNNYLKKDDNYYMI